jgi:RNA polymerase sigma factor (sigma-70 family)
MLEELRSNNNNIFSQLYKSHYSSIANYIKANKGSEQDAEDVFQETVIILLDKIKQQNFELTASLKTYLFSIARNLWLNHLRDRKLTAVDDFENIDLEDTEEVNDIEAKSQKAHSLLERITAQCKRILIAIFLVGEPMDILMERMGWKNKHTAANQKYKCLEQARKKKDKKESFWESSH